MNTKYQSDFSLWLRFVVSLFCVIFIMVYWEKRGPANFLWFTDIALFMLVVALWINSAYLTSMAAVSAMLFELAWNADFFSKLIFSNHLFGKDATAYMFDVEFPASIKTLSLALHLSLPVLMSYMLLRLGYHWQAWKAQAGLLALLLPVCYLFTDPERNINWVFGVGGVQNMIPGWLYVVVEVIFIILVVYVPTHLVLKMLFHKAAK